LKLTGTFSLPYFLQNFLFCFSFISRKNADSFNADISDDGNYMVFQSDATNLVAGDTNSLADIFLRDLVNNTTTRISLRSDGS